MSVLPKSELALKRDIGLWLFALYGAGNIIGAGIYVLVGKVAGEAGLFAPFAFIIAAIIAGLTGLSYGELGARYPVSAGEAVYLQRAFHQRWLSIAVGLLIAMAGLVSAATMARGFIGYFNVLFDVPSWLVVFVLVGLLTLVAARGIAESARVAALLTLISVGGLVWVIAVASPNLVHLSEYTFSDLVPLTSVAWIGVAGGAFLAFYAFIGFEDMVNIAEEVQHPERNIPRGILLAFGLSTVLYVLIALVAIVTLNTDSLAGSTAPLADVYETATGEKAAFISLIGLLAVINGALIQIIMASRIFYGMSRNGWLPEFLSSINARSQTPLNATLIAGVLVLLMALTLPLVGLAKATSGMVLIVFILINLSLLRIKRLEPLPENVRPVPVWVPWLAMMFSTTILVLSVWQ